MEHRTFEFRLRSSHGTPDRHTQSLVVELLSDSGEWQPQVPSLTTPGFRLYLLSLLLCQHHYLVANAQERAIPLQQVKGSFTVTTSADWILEQVHGAFSIQLDPATSPEDRAGADADALDYIRERMKLCPVSRNLAATVAKHIELNLAD